jgi:MoaA/NifB/PqqE/SkfB family radical SAM enzyme
VIRIRFPPGATVPDALASMAGVSVTNDQKVVVAEAEKNRTETATAVDRLLRPVYRDLWSVEPHPLFGLVSVETRSACNNECAFCPVARSVDRRPPGELGFALLEKIAAELGTLNFTGRVCLFGNNEPLLDDRLVEIVGLFGSSCPGADLRILTNGILVNRDIVTALFGAGLSTLVINNYTDGRRLISPVRDLIEHAGGLASFDIRVSVRNRREVLTTRAGLAPNKPAPEGRPRGFCALPFTDLHIPYTGEVNLCCFDAYGQVRVGNVAELSLPEIWRAPEYRAHRTSLMRSVRAGLTLCENCDFDGFASRIPAPGTR